MKILKFFASWCKPCSALSETLKNANIEHESIDVSSDTDLTEKYDIRSIPTLVIIDENGNEVGRILGSKSKEQILEELKKCSTANNTSN